MIGIQAMWSKWIANNPTNKMYVRKVQKESFYAGAEMMFDHLNADARLAAEFASSNPEPLRVIKGGLDDDAE